MTTKPSKKIQKLRCLSLFNDTMTKGVTTFTNAIGDSVVVIIMPSDFKEWEQVTISYYPHKL